MCTGKKSIYTFAKGQCDAVTVTGKRLIFNSDSDIFAITSKETSQLQKKRVMRRLGIVLPLLLFLLLRVSTRSFPNIQQVSKDVLS